MRRADIIQATERVLRDIEESGIFLMINRPLQELRGSRSEPKSDASWFNFSTFQDYSVRVASYSDVEKQVLDFTDLDTLSNARFWEDIVKSGEVDSLISIRNTARYSIENLPKFIRLIRRESDSTKDEIIVSQGKLAGKSAFTIILPEEKGEYSSPERIILAISSVSDMYAVISEVNNQSSKDLILLSCDSGSEKMFDFAGSGELMKQLKDLLLGLWDRVVYHSHNQTQATFATISSSLPILDEISRLEKSHSIDAETCAMLRHRIIISATKFLESGAITEDMSRIAENPRVLMRPQPRLLAGPSESVPAPNASDSQGFGEVTATRNRFSDLSPEDLAGLRAMLDPAPTSPAPKKPTRRAKS